MSTTYSFKDTSGTYTNPAVGAFSFAGQIGVGRFIVAMATERTVHDVAADGNIMASYIAGDNGSLSVEVQQTSDLHAFLLDAYNILKSAADGGDVSNWLGGQITLRNIVDGSNHILNGVSFSKIPDKPYAAQGERITWVLMAADVQNSIS